MMEAGAEQVMPRARRQPGGANQVVRIAVASKDRIMVNLHFGHAQEFLIFEASGKGTALVDVRRAPQYCHGEEACCEGEVLLPQVFSLLSDCQYLLASRIGRTPGDYLRQRGIRCWETQGFIHEVLAPLARGEGLQPLCPDADDAKRKGK